VRLEEYWRRMSPGSYSDQEQLVTVASKVHNETWNTLRQSPTWRTYLVNYEKTKEALRGFVAEQELNGVLSSMREQRVMVIDPLQPSPTCGRGSRDGRILAMDPLPASSSTRRSSREPRSNGADPLPVKTAMRKNSKSNGVTFRGRVSCHYCGKVGHYMAECWKKFPEKRPRTRRPPSAKGEAPRPQGPPIGGDTLEVGSDPMDTSMVATRKRPRSGDIPLNLVCHIQSHDSPDGGGLKKGSLLSCIGNVWGRPLEFLVDTGAGLYGALSSSLLPKGLLPSQRHSQLLRVGDGRAIWSEGEVQV
jgi:hypothetical protein